MATESKHTVKPSGGDYTTLAGWEAGEQANLVTADIFAICEIDGDWSATEDSTACTVDGWTTDATRYIEIRTTAAARHNGTWGNGYRRTNSLKLAEEYVRVDGISMRVTTASTRVLYVSGSTGTGEVRVSNSYFETDGALHAVDIYSLGAVTAKIWNCIACATGTRYGFYLNDADATAYFYGCTGITGSGTAFKRDAGTCYCKNCLGYSSSGSSFTGTMSAVNYCASDDATADDWGGTGNRISQTFTFVDATNQDYHLASTDAGARDYGTDLSGDADVPFSTDIDGTTRSGSWDIGADEYTSGGSALTVSVTDAMSMGEGRTSGADKLLTEALGLGDARSLGAAKALADALLLAEARALTSGKALADALAMGESRSLGATKSFSDGMSMGEARDLVLVLLLALADAMSLGEARVLGAGKGLADALLFGESRQFAIAKVLADALLLTEAHGFGYFRALVDSLGLSDAVSTSLARLLAAVNIWRAGQRGTTWSTEARDLVFTCPPRDTTWRADSE